MTYCKNVRVPEIIQAMEQEQGASAGPSRTARMWVHDMCQPMSIIKGLLVDSDYNFSTSFLQAFETLNAGSISRLRAFLCCASLIPGGESRAVC